MAQSTTLTRNQWQAYRCAIGLRITLWHLSPYLLVPAHEAGQALFAAIHGAGYPVPEIIGSHRNCPLGIGGKVCHPNGTDCSLHNYSLALDLDYFGYGNPHLHRRMTPSDPAFRTSKIKEHHVKAVEAIRTNNGKQVWKWLGWSIGDTMHFEITCSPADLATGINWFTVNNGVVPEPAPPYQEYQEEDMEQMVKDIQELLNLNGYTDMEGKMLLADGIWGARTRAAYGKMVADRGKAGPPGPSPKSAIFGY